MARQTLTKEEIQNYKKGILESAKKIIDEKGYDKTTAKELSKLSLLNIAYLYKFFTDIEEIKLYCSIMDLKSYIDELTEKKIYLSEMNDMDRYYATWEIFLKHCFNHRASYRYLYFSEHSHNLTNIIKDYYVLFPQTFEDFTENMMDIMTAPNINYRTDAALYPALRGKIDNKDIELISKITVAYIKKLLFDTDSTEKEVVDKQIDEMMYVIKFLNRGL